MAYCQDQRGHDCFAWGNGVCMALQDTYFRGGCTFYKTRAEYLKQLQAVAQRLKSLNCGEIM